MPTVQEIGQKAPRKKGFRTVAVLPGQAVPAEKPRPTCAGRFPCGMRTKDAPSKAGINGDLRQQSVGFPRFLRQTGRFAVCGISTPGNWDFSEYQGKRIATLDKKIIAAGETLAEAYDQALEAKVARTRHSKRFPHKEKLVNSLSE